MSLLKPKLFIPNEFEKSMNIRFRSDTRELVIVFRLILVWLVLVVDKPLSQVNNLFK